MLNDTPKSNAELARAIGISPPMLHKLKVRGMPVDSLRAAIAWRAANLNPASRKDSPGHSPGKRPNSDRPIRVANDETFDQARTRKESALADQAENLVARQHGELIEKAGVAAALGRSIADLREAFLAVPARLAPVLAGKSIHEVQTLVDTELRHAIAGFVASLETTGVGRG